MRLSARNFLVSLFIFLLIIWTIFASFRVFFNVSKVFTEERPWIFASDLEKRERIYGDLEQIYSKITTQTTAKNSLYLLTDDGKAYFVLRYLLYPIKVYWVSDIKGVTKNISGDYILFYHKNPLRVADGFSFFSSFNLGSSESSLYKAL